MEDRVNGIEATPKEDAFDNDLAYFAYILLRPELSGRPREAVESMPRFKEFKEKFIKHINKE